MRSYLRRTSYQQVQGIQCRDMQRNVTGPLPETCSSIIMEGSRQMFCNILLTYYSGTASNLCTYAVLDSMSLAGERRPSRNLEVP